MSAENRCSLIFLEECPGYFLSSVVLNIFNIKSGKPFNIPQ